MENPLQISEKAKPLLEVLSNRLFRRLWIGQIASQLGINMLLFLLALVLYQKTQSNAIVSGLFLSYGLPSLFFGMVAGVVVDRLDRRAVLIASHVIRAVFIAFLLVFELNVPAIYLLVFLYALVSQFTTPSEAPLIPNLVPKAQIVPANSLFSLSFYTSMALGFISAGPILRMVGAYGAYWVIFGLFISAALSISGLPPQGAGLMTLDRIFAHNFLYLFKKVLSDLGEGVQYVSKSRNLIDAVILLTGTQITIVLLGTLGPGFADKILKIDIRDASMVIVGPAILGILAGSFWVGNNGERFSPGKLMVIGIMAAGCILIAVSAVVAATNVFWFQLIPRWLVLTVAFSLFVLLGVANSFLDVPANSMIQKETIEDMRGRVYGLLSAVVGGFGVLPVVVSGVLADLIGVGKVIFLLGCCIVWYGVYRLKKVHTV
jgi:MFS family permease